MIEEIVSKTASDWGASLNYRAKEVGELTLFFSAMLLFGTFIVGIAQSLSDHQVVIDGIKLLSYKQDYLYTLSYSGSAIIGGCLVGLIGLFLYTLIYNISLRNYIVNAFLFDAYLFILLGILYFINYMVSGQPWFIKFISAILIVAAICVLTYYFYSAIHNKLRVESIERQLGEMARKLYLKNKG